MTATWIRRGERKYVVTYSQTFEWSDCPGAGFSFDCDENGDLLKNEQGEHVSRWGDVWMPAASENYQMCLRGEDERGIKITYKGIEKYEHSYWEPGVIECDLCGAEVELDMTMTNTCHACRHCGKESDYFWHLVTAKQCDALMQAHEGRDCASPDDHHTYFPCNADYNMSGQRLAPREQWGWDTGESLAEIEAANMPINDPWRGWGFDDE